MKTDATGRAEFAGLAPGTRVTATTTVQGERLQSQEFPVPASGGTRLLLVATDPDVEKRAAEDRSLAAAPAQPGLVVIGEESRFVFELGDGSLSVFNLLQLVNTARTPVQSTAADRVRAGRRGDRRHDPQGFVAAGDGRRWQGDRRRAVCSRRHERAVRVHGAVLDGKPDRRADSAGSPRPRIVLAQKAGDMRVASAQMSEQREMPADGQTYVVGQGPGLRAGERLCGRLQQPAA